MTNEMHAPKRNLEQFLDDQRRHEEEKMMKKNMILEEESRAEGNIEHHPHVDEKSAAMVESKRHGPVYDRLYDISKEK